MTEKEEKAWVAGNRAAWLRLLGVCLRELGYDSAEAEEAGWIVEREETLRVIRALCEAHGDNDWPNGLHLGDALEKHLTPYLDEPDEA